MADEKTDPGTTDEQVEPRKSLEADYRDATPEDVALALLRYRRGRETRMTPCE